MEKSKVLQSISSVIEALPPAEQIAPIEVHIILPKKFGVLPIILAGHGLSHCAKTHTDIGEHQSGRCNITA